MKITTALHILQNAECLTTNAIMQNPLKSGIIYHELSALVMLLSVESVLNGPR